MKLAVTWEMKGYIDIPEAKSIDEAMEIFKRKSDDIELPKGEYVDSSFRLTDEDAEIQKVLTLPVQATPCPDVPCESCTFDKRKLM